MLTMRGFIKNKRKIKKRKMKRLRRTRKRALHSEEKVSLTVIALHRFIVHGSFIRYRFCNGINEIPINIKKKKTIIIEKFSFMFLFVNEPYSGNKSVFLCKLNIIVSCRLKVSDRLRAYHLIRNKKESIIRLNDLDNIVQLKKFGSSSGHYKTLS
ncbi:hypothetical protein V1478_008096 [Vespula squamosa]|uniref:Ribosomal protein S4 n=1 Tax=Vespula squamosa TaxID=30214 RepID=A0ABD2AXU4_VESSQ